MRASCPARGREVRSVRGRRLVGRPFQGALRSRSLVLGRKFACSARNMALVADSGLCEPSESRSSSFSSHVPRHLSRFLAAGRLAGCATGVETPKERDYGRGTHVESSQNRFEDTGMTLKPQEAPRATRNKRGKRPVPGRWRLERRRAGARNSPRRRFFLPGRRAPGVERCRSS